MKFFSKCHSHWSSVRAALWFGPLLLVLTGGGVLMLTWGSWLDPVVDFGRELYVPWRLVEGEKLFQDIAWFNGPLSQYFNSCIFRLFGVGLSTIVWTNIILLAVTVGTFYLLLQRLADRVAATAAGLVFLLAFACNQYLMVGNYNWICPYSHELTHGITLSVILLLCLDFWSKSASRMALFFGGMALGLVFLTKAEVFLAAAVASVILLVLGGKGNALHSRRRLHDYLLFVVAFSLPIILSLILLSTTATFGAWSMVAKTEVAKLPFYLSRTGLDQPLAQIYRLLFWSFGWLLILSVPFLSAWFGNARLFFGTPRWLLPVVVVGVEIAALSLLHKEIHWFEALAPLPLFTLVGGAILGYQVWFRGRRGLGSVLALAAFSFVLLFKMVLNTHIYNYGFALALPATLFVVTALVSWIPDWIEAHGGRGIILRIGALVLLLWGVSEHLSASNDWLEQKTEIVGSGRDSFRADTRGAVLNDVFGEISSSGAKSLAVIPEGVLINYLARIPNPTQYINFMPPEELLFGDSAWSSSFDASPPDLVLVMPKDTTEYGRGDFGTGYGESLAQWVDKNYAPVGHLRRENSSLEIWILAPKLGIE